MNETINDRSAFSFTICTYAINQRPLLRLLIIDRVSGHYNLHSFSADFVFGPFAAMKIEFGPPPPPLFQLLYKYFTLYWK